MKPLQKEHLNRCKRGGLGALWIEKPTSSKRLSTVFTTFTSLCRVFCALMRPDPKLDKRTPSRTRITNQPANKESSTMPRIYVGTYAKYNDGNLYGAWLDLGDYADKEEFLEACEMLHRDEDDPELMFQDWEEIPERMVAESHVDEALWQWLGLSASEQALLNVYLSDVNQSGDIEQAREAYLGQYGSESDWPAKQWEESGMLESIPKDLRSYIDYESYARECRLSGDITFVRKDGETWVFKNN